jgi:hypothetical protein
MVASRGAESVLQHIGKIVRFGKLIPDLNLSKQLKS